MALPTEKLKKGQTSTASDGDVYEWLGGLWRNTRNKRIGKREIQSELTAANVPQAPKASVESLSGMSKFFEKKESVDKETNSELSNVVKNTKTTNKLLKELIGFFKMQADKADDPTSSETSIEKKDDSSTTHDSRTKPKKIFDFVLAGLIKSLSFVFKKMPIFLVRTLPRLMIKGISSMFNAVFKGLPRFIMRTLLPAIGKGLLKLFVGAGGILAMIIGFAEEIFSGGSLGDAFGAAIGQLVELFTGGFIQKEEVKNYLKDLGSQIGKWVFNAIEDIKKIDFKKEFEKNLEEIKTTITGFGTWIYDKAKTAYDLFLNWFSGQFPSTSAEISNLYDQIKEPIQSFSNFLKGLTDLPNIVMRESMSLVASGVDAAIPDSLQSQEIREFIVKYKKTEAIDSQNLMGDTMSDPPLSVEQLRQMSAKKVQGKIDTPEEKKFLAETLISRIRNKEISLEALNYLARRASEDRKYMVGKILPSAPTEAQNQNLFKIFPNLKTELSQIFKNKKTTDIQSAASNLNVIKQDGNVYITNNNNLNLPSTDVLDRGSSIMLPL
jgi:hypothetical protein